MQQVLQDLRSGQTRVAEVPSPACRAGCVLIRTSRTLISAGTERMLVEFGKASLLAKARSQPEKVKQVLDKIKSDGLLPTIEAVFSKLDEPVPLGYCNAGVVLEVGRGVTGFATGDRVASNGPHAEIVCVPKNLCTKVPDEITDDQAAFTVLSSIALQGIRLVGASFGEKVVVFGLGLIGLVTVQLLRACGCDVLGVDVNPERLRLAANYGASTVQAGGDGDPVTVAGAWTEGRGADAVLITASAKTDEIVHQAAEMSRKRGRIVLVGVVGLNLRRGDFYQKELTFQVSCSYGPGRYDDSYELNGLDYPYGFVRWTEQRNFQAILDVMKGGRLVVDGLITHRLPQREAGTAYEKICANREEALGVILTYPSEVVQARQIRVSRAEIPPAGEPVVSVIGAGNFAKMTLMPALSQTEARIAYIADLDGAAAQHVAKKFRASKAVTDHRLVLQDEHVNAVIIAADHSAHAELVCEALQAGKHVFVEKPLAMNVDELKQIVRAAADHPNKQLLVGFNRRFSRHTERIKRLLADRGQPLAMNMTVNAGIIPPEHWVHDPVRGGGRIIGEACHFIDLMVHLSGSRVATVAAVMMGRGVAVHEDKMSITLGFEDGSVGTVNYFGNGPKSYPKETLEVFSDGRVLRLDNFRRLRGFGFRFFRDYRSARQDKGHAAELAAFVNRVGAGGEPLIPLDELVNVTLASFAAVTAAAENRTIILAQEYRDVLTGPAGGVDLR